MTFNDAIIMDAFHPGAAKFGNFINYYEFNSTESRSKLLKDDFMSYLNGFSSDIVALDVGCNIGVRTP